jgi:hypothetical protein
MDRIYVGSMVKSGKTWGKVQEILTRGRLIVRVGGLDEEWDQEVVEKVSNR